MKKIFLYLLIILNCSSTYLFGQDDCRYKIDGVEYYIFLRDRYFNPLKTRSDTIIHHMNKSAIKSYIGDEKIKFFDIDEDKLISLNSTLKFAFNEYNSISIDASLSDYHIQITNLYKGKKKVTFGHLNLEEELTGNDDLCDQIRTVMDGGVSFISFAYDWCTEKLLFFKTR